MNRTTFLLTLAALTSGLALAKLNAADADEINITGTAKGTEKPIPVSLSGFSGEADQVLRFDLEVGGCQIVSGGEARYNITGSASASEIRGELTDAVTKSVLLNNRYAAAPVRTLAHNLADDLLEKITGKRGVSRFKIAFKSNQGGRTEIHVADFDGANVQAVTQDGALLAAPAWVPGKRVLYYTSYKAGSPDIYRHDLGTGERRRIAAYSGLNTSAAISPDGRRVAMILSKGGSPDLYVCDADGGNLRQLTRTKEDESSPCWSPDGQNICFVSSSAGQPGLYVISANGGSPRRIRTPGASRVSEPDWSPDGKLIAFTLMSGEFTVCTVPAQGGEVTRLAPGEDPSWAPNSRTLIFTRRNRGKHTLSLLDAPTKRVKDVAHNLGNGSQPSWAK